MSEVDSRDFRNACGHFVTGVTVISTRCAEGEHGMTANAYVEALDKAGLLTRYTDEKRVDQRPMLMEQNPNTAEKTTSSLPDNQLKDDGSQAEGNGLARMSFR